MLRRQVPVPLLLALVTLTAPPAAEAAGPGDDGFGRAGAARKRLPPPSPDEQEQADRMVRELFPEAFAVKSATSRKVQAEVLFRQAADTADDPVGRFALLRASRDMAAAAGDYAGAVRAIDEITRAYAVRPLPMKLDALRAAAKAVATPGRTKVEASEIALGAVALAREAVAADDFPAAEEAVAIAEAAGTRAGSAKLLEEAKAVRAEMAVFKSESDRAAAAAEVLKTRPNDPQANDTLGRILCFVKGDWRRGVRHLAKSPDPTLSKLARQELPPGPRDIQSVASLAGGWWEAAAAEPEGSLPRRRLRERACYWYARGMPQFRGLTKKLAEKRLSETPTFNPVLAAAAEEDMQGGAGGDAAAGDMPRRVVFLCDASGSMINHLQAINADVAAAVDALEESQTFTVLCFNGDGILALDGRLLPATPQNKRRVRQFLAGVETKGPTDPVPSFAAAFNANPDVIHFYTDGDFPEGGPLLAALARLNADKRVVINTVVCATPGQDPAQFPAATEIARQHKGQSRMLPPVERQ